MKYLRWLLIGLAIFACSATLAYTMMVLTTSGSPPGELVSVNSVELVLKQLGLPEPTWQTLVLTATRDAPIPAANLWSSWARLEDWPAWSPRHTSARWLSDAQWVEGAQFEETLELDFPLYSVTYVETIAQVTSGTSAMWCQAGDGVRSCQVWLFESLPDGLTRVTHTEILHGSRIAALRLAVKETWQRQIEAGVETLIQQSAAAPNPD